MGGRETVGFPPSESESESEPPTRIFSDPIPIPGRGLYGPDPEPEPERASHGTRARESAPSPKHHPSPKDHPSPGNGGGCIGAPDSILPQGVGVKRWWGGAPVPFPRTGQRHHPAQRQQESTTPPGQPATRPRARAPDQDEPGARPRSPDRARIRFPPPVPGGPEPGPGAGDRARTGEDRARCPVEGRSGARTGGDAGRQTHQQDGRFPVPVLMASPFRVRWFSLSGCPVSVVRSPGGVPESVSVSVSV
jgi:hypothetical protein